MNHKITVRTHSGELRFFIIDPKADISRQLAAVHGSTPGHGIDYQMTDREIQVIDYFCGEVMFAHTILSVEDTEESVSLQWHKLTE